MKANRRARPRTFSLEALQEASVHYNGFCLDCGTEHEMCEPDTRERRCEECGKASVYGASELMVMGAIR